MELYKEILSHMLAMEDVYITFPNFQFDVTQIVESRCYQALCDIKEILSDDSLEDDECFWRIEEIVNTFEGLGSTGGGRHDFG